MPPVTINGLKSAEATDTVRSPYRGRSCRRLGVLLLFAIGAAHADHAVAQTCVGNCNGDGTVEISELILGVNIALGVLDISECTSFDDGRGTVTVDRLIAAVSNSLCGCAPCPTPVPDTATPTATLGTATPTATPTSGESVSMWTVDNYEVVSSDCAGRIEDAVVSALRAGGSDFTVRQSGDHVEVEDGDGNVFEGTVDVDGTVGVQRTIRDSIGPCDYEVSVDASANLSDNSAIATYNGMVNVSGFCAGLSDCSLQITSSWHRLEG